MKVGVQAKSHVTETLAPGTVSKGGMENIQEAWKSMKNHMEIYTKLREVQKSRQNTFKTE